MRQRLIGPGLGIAAVFGIALAGPAAGDTAGDANNCRSLITSFAQSLKAHDSAAARGLITDIDVFCPPKNRIAARSHLGLLVARIAGVERQRGAEIDALYREVEEYLPYADHWEMRAQLGSLAMDLKRYDAATRHYFQALNLMEHTGYTAKAPSAETIHAVHAAASEALVLTEIPVEPTTRGGGTAAYFAPSVRGIGVPKKTPQITFVTGSDEFDQQGRVTAERLLPILRRESPNEITIIGHTDERGDDAYNLDLSGRRATRIRTYLQQNGFAGTIRALWCGERIPVNIDNPDRFTQEERWRINRRVEVYYGQGNQESGRYDNACNGS